MSLRFFLLCWNSRKFIRNTPWFPQFSMVCWEEDWVCRSTCNFSRIFPAICTPKRCRQFASLLSTCVSFSYISPNVHVWIFVTIWGFFSTCRLHGAMLQKSVISIILVNITKKHHINNKRPRCGKMENLSFEYWIVTNRKLYSCLWYPAVDI